jgi:hypothetical protein
MKRDRTEMRQMNERDKTALAKDLGKLSEALQTDQSTGAPLPTGTFWRLRIAAQDARRFLGRR